MAVKDMEKNRALQSECPVGGGVAANRGPPKCGQNYRQTKSAELGENQLDAMPTPNHIRAFELRLKDNWSSEDVVQMLTREFVESVLLKGFAALEPATKVRHKLRALLLKVARFTLLRRDLRKLPPGFVWTSSRCARAPYSSSTEPV